VTGGEVMLALEIATGTGTQAGEAAVRTASLVDPDWLRPRTRRVVHHFDSETGCVRATEEVTFEGLVLEEHPGSPLPEEAGRILSRVLGDRGLGEGEELLRRLRFAALP